MVEESGSEPKGGKETESTHLGTTGGCWRRVCKEGRHVVVVEVDGGMGESSVRVVLIVRG